MNTNDVIARRAVFSGLVMTTLLIFPLIINFGCKSSYPRDTIVKSVKDMAKKDYNLDVDVILAGETLGIQFRIKNIMGEMVAEDQLLWKQMENLMMVLSRVVLSSDKSPQFIVLDIVDEDNPRLHFVLTRYVEDLHKVMSEGLSRTHFLDRLLMELVIGEKRLVFDPMDMDMVRLLMLAVDVPSEDNSKEVTFPLTDIDMRDFMSKVTSNIVRRLFREEKMMVKTYSLRDVTASFRSSLDKGKEYQILLDLVSLPEAQRKYPSLEQKIFPTILKEAAYLFKSYKFDQFQAITVMDRNSGRSLTTLKN